jgi:beta-lactam-binding protein with PASTA domain
MVIPRLLGLDIANAVAEVQYLQMIPALVDRGHRPFVAGVRDDTGWRVVKQDPRAGAEVVVSDLTTTITITVGCRSGCRDSRRTTSRRHRRSHPSGRSAGGHA